MVVSELRVNLPQILAVSIKNIILIAFGMTLGFPTVLIPALQEKTSDDISTENDDFYLSKAQISWISSINLICVPLGCVFSGSFTAYLGRRRAMQLACVPILASWVIFYFSHDVLHLYLALCLSGFTGGMLEAPVLTYVAEITTPALRGLLSASGSFCIILGVFSQFLMGIYFDWRTITLISTFVPVLAILCLFFVPESPHWLILKNRIEEAKESLMWLRGWQKSYESIKPEFEELLHNLTAKEDVNTEESLLKAFKRRTFLLPYFICSLAFFVGHFSGMTTLQTYAVPIFAQLRAPVDKYFATMLLGIVELLGTALCVMLVRFAGKRKLTFFSILGCCVCFFSTSIYAYFVTYKPESPAVNVLMNLTEQIAQTFNANSSEADQLWSIITSEVAANISASEPSLNVTESIAAELQENEHSWIPLTLLLSSALLSHCGIRLLPWMLVGEVFPSRIRGIASGLTGGTSYIFGFLANKLFLTMLSGLTLPGTFLFYSCVSAVGCIILFILLPETEGRTLQEIEDHFSGKKKLPRTLKRKEPPSEVPFPTKFDISKWESNEKFKKHLQQRKISQTNPKNYDPKLDLATMGVKRKPEPMKRQANVNDDDFDTPL